MILDSKTERYVHDMICMPSFMNKVGRGSGGAGVPHVVMSTALFVASNLTSSSLPFIIAMAQKAVLTVVCTLVIISITDALQFKDRAIQDDGVP